MKRNALNTNALYCKLSVLHGAIFRRTANLFSANYGKPLKELPRKSACVPVIVGISYDSTPGNNLFHPNCCKIVGMYFVGIPYDSAQQRVNSLGAGQASEKLTIPVFEPKNFGMRSICCKATENPGNDVGNLYKISFKGRGRCSFSADWFCKGIVIIKHQAFLSPHATH